MISADVHMHSYFSADSEEPARKMIEAALAKGLKTVCFTEHHEFEHPEGDMDFTLDADSYKSELMRLREEYAGKIEILFGVELGMLTRPSDKPRKFTENMGFDFIIGSTHYVDGVDPYYPEYFEKHGAKNGLLRYFEVIFESVDNFSDFDVYGHLDYAARYSPEKNYEPLDYREIIDEILKKLVAMGKGTEVNTAGLKNLPFPNPHGFILSRYRELGGEIITVGADAHGRDRVAADLGRAEEALRAAGFRYYTVFRNRKPEFIPLDG